MFRNYVLWGIVLWLGATLLFRYLGHLLLGTWMSWVLFAAAVPLIYMCTALIYRWRNVPASDCLLCSCCIALPGMLLDIASLLLPGQVFPAIPEERIPVLAAWLLWAYSLIVLFGFPWRNALSAGRRSIQ
ncbi:hypothetical protein GCM10023310_51560 [Paenibacillus vulneris]|uniref:DUF5367 family protein n=1 Tax=Paenibacillus vulneris TaxID=1133364 RepID=A0ABW3UJ38_9BACL